MLLCVTTGEKETDKGWGLNAGECMGLKMQMQGGLSSQTQHSKNAVFVAMQSHEKRSEEWNVRLWNSDPMWACSSSSEGAGFIHVVYLNQYTKRCTRCASPMQTGGSNQCKVSCHT